MARHLSKTLAVVLTALTIAIPFPHSGWADPSETEIISKVDLSYLVNTRRPIWMGPVIRYTVFEKTNVEARVTSLTGELVMVMHVGEQEPGQHTLPWDGTIEDGQVVFEGKFHFELFFGDEFAADFWFASKSLQSFEE